MSWHILKDCENSLCSQEQEEASSEAICWDGERFAPSSGQTTLGRYCLPDSETGSCPDSRSGMMSRPSTETHGEGESMSSQAGSHVRTSAQPGKAQESTGRGLECGSTWPGSFAKYDPDSSSWKTPQYSLLEGLDVFSETWPRWGTMRNGECWELPTLEGAMTGTESGFSHPTPTCSDHKGACAREEPRMGQLKDWMFETLTHSQSTIYPTPGFMERVMGWPIGWTELKPLPMGNLQQWRQQHSGF